MRKHSEYARQCAYEAGPDYKDRILKCQKDSGHRDQHYLLASWTFDINPYETLWDSALV